MDRIIMVTVLYPLVIPYDFEIVFVRFLMCFESLVYVWILEDLLINQYGVWYKIVF